MFKHVHTLNGTRYRSAEIKACVNELLINNVGLGSAFSIWHFLKKNYVSDCTQQVSALSVYQNICTYNILFWFLFLVPMSFSLGFYSYAIVL